MFTFKNFEDSYNVQVQHIMPDDSCHLYDAKMDVKATTKARDLYVFTLLGRHDVLIDGVKPEHASDIVMQEISNSMYPTLLEVKRTGEIAGVENFEEMKERWIQKRSGYQMKFHAMRNHKEWASINKYYTVLPVFVDSNIKKTDGAIASRQQKEGDYVYFELNVDMLMDDGTYYRRNIIISKDENFKRTVNLLFH